MSRIKVEELEIGDNLKVINVGGQVKYYTITAVDEIFYRDEHSSLSAQSEEDYSEVTALDPPEDQIYCITTIETNSNIKIYVKQPAATNRFGTNRSPEGGMLIDLTSSLMNARKVNIWISANNPPAVKVVNPTNVTITPVIWWIGRRFAVRELEKKPEVYKTVRIGGIGS